jgi:Ca-activated chloride channel family protein
MTDLNVEFDGFDVYNVEPKSIPDVFADRPIIIFGKWKDEFGGNIKISGLYGKERYYVDINVLKFATRTNNDALKYLWARNKISELSDFRTLGFDENVISEVTDLGLKYNLLTEYTSFVAVDYLKRNEGDSIITVKQTLPLPEGVSDYAVGSGGAMGGLVNTQSLMMRNAPMLLQDDALSVRSSRVSEFQIESDDKNIKMEQLNHTPPLVDLSEIQKNVVYPIIAKKAGFEGKVVLRILVGIDGRAKTIEISYSDFSMFDSSAIDAVRKTKFTPAQVNGVAKEEWVTIPIQFKLNDDNKFKIVKILNGKGEVIQTGRVIKFKWSSFGIREDDNSANEIGETTYMYATDYKYQIVDDWFIMMRIGEKRKIIIPSSKSNDIIKLFNFKEKYKELKSITIELIEIK